MCVLWGVGWEWRSECESCFLDYDIPSTARGSHWMKARRELDVLKESGDFLFVSQCFKNISFDVWIESGDLFFWSQCVKLFHFCAHV